MNARPSATAVGLEPKRRKKKIYPEFPTIRFTVIGAVGVGKTTMIDSFVNNFFCEEQEPTKAVEYKADPGMEKTQSGSVVIEFEDTFGSNRVGDQYDITRVLHNVRNDKLYTALKENVLDEKFEVHSFRPFSFTGMKSAVTPNKSAVLILFDVNDTRTLMEAQRVAVLLKERLKQFQLTAMAPFPMIALVGTKCDERTPQQDENRITAEDFADVTGLHAFFISSKTFEGVHEMMTTLTKLVIGTPGLWQLRDVDSDDFTDNSDLLSSDDDDYK